MIIFVLLQVDEFFFNTFFEWLQPADLWLLLLSRLDDLRSGICYWRVSGKIERQQTKWVVLGITGTVFGGAVCGPGSAATASPSPCPGVHWEHPLLFVSAPHSALDWDDTTVNCGT